MKANVYTTEGKVKNTLDIPENIFGAKWNADLISQVINSQASNRRAATAHTKDRGEVAGGNKKPWRQKGTGRARHGSIRSPLWRHGGITFGPRVEKSYKKTITKSMKAGALFSLLSAKYAAGKIVFVDSIPSQIVKTKDADNLMRGLTRIEGFKTLTHKKPNNVYMAVASKENISRKAFRNLPYMTVHTVEDLNPLDIANSRYLVIANPEESIKYLSSKTK